MQIFVRNSARRRTKVHYKKHISPLSLPIDAAMCETTEKIDTKLGTHQRCYMLASTNIESTAKRIAREEKCKNAF